MINEEILKRSLDFIRSLVAAYSEETKEMATIEFFGVIDRLKVPNNLVFICENHVKNLVAK